MELVKVIMRPEKKFALKDVLADMGCHGITTKECSEFGESKETIKEIYNGRVYEQRTDVSNKREEVVCMDGGIVGNHLHMAGSGILLPRKAYGIPNDPTYQIIGCLVHVAPQVTNSYYCL